MAFLPELLDFQVLSFSAFCIWTHDYMLIILQNYITTLIIDASLLFQIIITTIILPDSGVPFCIYFMDHMCSDKIIEGHWHSLVFQVLVNIYL